MLFIFSAPVLSAPGTILIAAFYFSSPAPHFKTQTLNLSFLVQHAPFSQGYNPVLVWVLKMSGQEVCAFTKHILEGQYYQQTAGT